MQFPQPLKRGVLIRRYKRFLADVLLDEGGETTVHTPNPGAMLGLAEPGMTVWCSDSGSTTRKLPLTWELVEADGGIVGINTMAPNRLVAEALAADAIPELSGYASIRREVKYGEASRIDFLLESPGRPPCWLEIKNVQSFLQRDLRPDHKLWLEVKSVTLCRTKGLAEFPDCRSERAPRHLKELEAMAAAGDRAAVLFVIQRTDCDSFAACRDIDPKFADALDHAANAGVEVLVYDCDVGVEGVTIRKRISW